MIRSSFCPCACLLGPFRYAFSDEGAKVKVYVDLDGVGGLDKDDIKLVSVSAVSVSAVSVSAVSVSAMNVSAVSVSAARVSACERECS
jgi:hypothetical protein